MVTTVSLTVKTCPRCTLEKPIAAFNKNSASRDGHQCWCAECKAGYMREYMPTYQAVPENRQRQAETYRLRQYGVTPAVYARMLSEQDGKCAVCRQEHERYDIDHDHACCPGDRSCGECVRGLCCSNCNRGLGLLGDSADVLEAAAQYLRGHCA